MKENSIVEILDLLGQLENSEKAGFASIYTIQEEFLGLLEAERLLLPYSINILDEIHANENAHSRILLKLLAFRDGGCHPILESFFRYLEPPFSEIALTSPELTCEKSRIDLRVRCGDSSVILENKIHGAGDQELQIERYIQNEVAEGIQESRIFVLYLTCEGGSPSEMSISLKKGNAENAARI